MEMSYKRAGIAGDCRSIGLFSREFIPRTGCQPLELKLPKNDNNYFNYKPNMHQNVTLLVIVLNPRSMYL